MLRNYYTIAIRNLVRQKANSSINILGLAIGLACFILILLWVEHETTYDKFHKNYSNIYQVYEEQPYNSEKFYTYATPGPLAAKLQQDFPDIKLASRYKFAWMPVIVKYNETAFNEKKIAFVDDGFF